MNSTTDEIKIRELKTEDIDDLLKILQSTGVFKDYEIQVADEVLQDALKPGTTYRTYCAVNGEDRPLGYVCYGATPCTSGTYDLYWIAVRNDQQGRGVGKRLIEFAERDISKTGARLMLIETSSLSDYDATRHFYLSSGYKQLAMVPDFYRPGDHKIIYGKTFVP